MIKKSNIRNTNMRTLMNITEGKQLNELQGYKNTDEFKAFQDKFAANRDVKSSHGRRTLLHEFIGFLRSRGFQTLGNGAFGAVFEHPKLDYAIKIFRSDPAYFAFVKYLLANKGNPYLPKFRGRFMKLDQENYVVRMEKLAPLDRSDLYDTVLSVAESISVDGAEAWMERCEDCINKKFDEDAFKILTKEVNELYTKYTLLRDKFCRAQDKHLAIAKQPKTRIVQPHRDQLPFDLVGAEGERRPRDFGENIDVLRDQLDAAREAWYERRTVAMQMEDGRPSTHQLNCMQFSLDNRAFCQTIGEIIELGYSCDFHGGNFMMRGDVPVITDPLFDEESLD